MSRCWVAGIVFFSIGSACASKDTAPEVAETESGTSASISEDTGIADTGVAETSIGETGTSEGGGLSQTAACAAYLECATVVTPATLGELLETYGPEGSCWQSTNQVAEQCNEACINGLVQLQEVAPDEPACGGGADTGDTGDMIDDTSGTEGEAVSFSSDLVPVFMGTCAPQCHSPGGEWPTLNLSSDPYSSIVGVTSGQNSLMNYITPGAPEESYMLHKLNGTQIDNGGAGLSMPKAQVGRTEPEPLPPAFIEQLEAWVLAGAPDN